RPQPWCRRAPAVEAVRDGQPPVAPVQETGVLLLITTILVIKVQQQAQVAQGRRSVPENSVQCSQVGAAAARPEVRAAARSRGGRSSRRGGCPQPEPLPASGTGTSTGQRRER